MTTLIHRLNKIKEQRKISQEEMAREIGVSLLTLHNWINGKNKPSPLAEDKISEWLAKQDAPPRT